MSDKTWKAIERGVAKLLGGRRVPITGRQRGDVPDIEHPFYSLEVKHRQELPSWLHDAMAQAEASNDGTKTPLVILHEKGTAIPDSYAVIRLRDIIRLETH